MTTPTNTEKIIFKPCTITTCNLKKIIPDCKCYGFGCDEYTGTNHGNKPFNPPVPSGSVIFHGDKP